MITINPISEADDNVRYIKDENGKVRKMYVRKDYGDKIALQKTAEPRTDKPIYVYEKHTTYDTADEAENSFISRIAK